jgi:hypothetical protein
MVCCQIHGHGGRQWKWELGIWQSPGRVSFPVFMPDFTARMSYGDQFDDFGRSCTQRERR